jgi:hypothetical protein
MSVSSAHCAFCGKFMYYVHCGVGMFTVIRYPDFCDLVCKEASENELENPPTFMETYYDR